MFSIKREELKFSLLMAGYFFLVITTFWILKPLKKSAFLGYYKGLDGLTVFGTHFNPVQVEQFAKVSNMVVAFVAVAVFSFLSRKFVRQQLTNIFSGFCLCCFLCTTQPRTKRRRSRLHDETRGVECSEPIDRRRTLGHAFR